MWKDWWEISNWNNHVVISWIHWGISARTRIRQSEIMHCSMENEKVLGLGLAKNCNSYENKSDRWRKCDQMLVTAELWGGGSLYQYLILYMFQNLYNKKCRSPAVDWGCLSCLWPGSLVPVRWWWEVAGPFRGGHWWEVISSWTPPSAEVNAGITEWIRSCDIRVLIKLGWPQLVLSANG